MKQPGTARTVALTIATIALLGCGGDEPTPPTGGATVAASDFQFAPASVTIAPAGTVTWNFAGGPHNVTFSDANSGTKAAGTTYARSFANAGTFPYSCTLHPGMSGTVVVQ